jgi:hypothetical protein
LKKLITANGLRITEFSNQFMSMNSSLTLQGQKLKDLEYFKIPSIIPKKSYNINDETTVVNKNIKHTTKSFFVAPENKNMFL